MNTAARKDHDFTKVFEFDKKLLTFAGFYPRRTSDRWYLYFIATVISWYLSFAQVTFMTTRMVLDIADIMKVSEVLQYFTTHFTFMCKLINFAICKKRLLQIEDILTAPTLHQFIDEDCSMKKRIDSCIIVNRTFRIMCVMACLFYACVPYLDPAKATSLPIPGWFPYNVTEHYYPTFIYEMIGLCNTATVNVSIDCLTWMLISLASGQFDILKENLKKIDYMNENLKETEESFKNCVIHHREIVKLVNVIEDMFSRGIFVQFFASVVIICFTGFLMIIVPLYSTQFVFLVMYFICMIFQVAVYCWYGHEIMTTSSTIGESFYISNWYEADSTMRKSFLVFVEKTKKPVTLTAGGYVTLSLTTLSSILRSSYSYVAVLRRLYSP